MNLYRICDRSSRIRHDVIHSVIFLSIVLFPVAGFNNHLEFKCRFKHVNLATHLPLNLPPSHSPRLGLSWRSTKLLKRGPTITSSPFSSSALFYELNELKKGCFIEYEGQPYEIIDTVHFTPGRLAAYTKAKLRHVINGAFLERNFKGANIPEADVTKEIVSFVRNDSVAFIFQMTDATEVQIKKNLVPNPLLLKPGVAGIAFFWKEKLVKFMYSGYADYKVTDLGSDDNWMSKDENDSQATLETGLKLTVPPSVKVGQIVRVNTQECRFTSKVKSLNV